MLQTLARHHIAQDAIYPPEGSPEGVITRITVERFGGVGHWST